jgi:hypothetical protein
VWRDDRRRPYAVQKLSHAHNLPGPFGQEHEESHRPGIEFLDLTMPGDLAEFWRNQPVSDPPDLASVPVHYTLSSALGAQDFFPPTSFSLPPRSRWRRF